MIEESLPNHKRKRDDDKPGKPNGDGQHKRQNRGTHNSSSRSGVRCTYCKKPGHTIDKCFRKAKKDSKGGDTKDKLTGDVDSNEVHLASTGKDSAPISPSSIEVKLDSGADKSIFTHKAWCETLSECEEPIVGINGSIKVSGRGKVVLPVYSSGAEGRISYLPIENALFYDNPDKNPDILSVSVMGSKHGNDNKFPGERSR